MAEPDLASRRLRAQRVAGAPFEDPGAAVRALGAVQAQDYAGALWAIGLRTRAATEASVEGAVAARELVRTWPMRGTLHFVPAADARWMLELLTPRVARANASRQRALGLDGAAFARSRKALERALRGGRSLPRPGIYAALEAAGVATAGQRGIHVIQQLAHDRFLVFAAREGRQATFALFDEWLPGARSLPREEALAELAARYFTGHGPATLEDFTWWTKLTVADARAALALARPRLVREVAGGREWWRAARAPEASGSPDAVTLLPAFDECLVGYRDRSAMLAPEDAHRVHHLLSPTILSGGRVIGTWTRRLEKDAVVVRAALFPGRRRAPALAGAAEAYGRFLGRPVVLA